MSSRLPRVLNLGRSSHPQLTGHVPPISSETATACMCLPHQFTLAYDASALASLVMLACDLTSSLRRCIPHQHSIRRYLHHLPWRTTKPEISLAASAGSSLTWRSTVSMSAVRRADHSSFSNPEEVIVKHSHFELSVDFDSKVIEGYAQLQVEAVGDAPKTLTLDTRDLTLHKVTLLSGSPAAAAAAAVIEESGRAAPEQSLQYALADKHPSLGSALNITLPPGIAAGSKLSLGVRFSCSPNSTALQFLDPAQTAGGKHPYLFTQCQAIHARSLVPCQDTPAVKSSYSAAVRVPAALTALMSAVPTDGPPTLPDGSTAAEGTLHLDSEQAAASGGDGSSRVFYFNQKVCIPSYLIALAVGELEKRDLSERTCVWSEPSVVDAAAYEFAETAKFLDTGEELAGPYVWGRYDLLVLPPSFPYGGMENPCLTFVTPTLLAKDRSLTNVVAHEIAHSWTGNLVTNASWEHFWLNEGWTVFLERKIVGRLQGDATLQFQAQQGALTLEQEINQIGVGHNFTKMIPDLSGGEDPDDAFSRVPYEKGFYFLYYLQELVGGPSEFEPFMRHYLNKFAFNNVDSEQFKATFCEFFKHKPAIADVDWDTWLHAPGMPPVKNSYDGSLATAAYDLASAWHTADVMGIGADPPAAATPDDLKGWGTAQVCAFLDKLGELRSLQPLAASMCRKMNEMYGLDSSQNYEIRCSWYKLCIAAKDAAIYPHVVDMLSTQGRMKYLRPLYRALWRSGSDGQKLALDTFSAVKDKYHPIAKKMVETDLKLRTAPQ